MAAIAFYLGLSTRPLPSARLERERQRKLHRLHALLAEIALTAQASARLDRR